MIGLSEAARLLAVSAMTVRRLADKGDIDSIRTPLGRVVSRASVEQVAEERRQRQEVGSK
jgi:excisionase family DNA binding protein